MEPLSYHQRLTLLALRDSLSKSGAMHTAIHIFEWGGTPTVHGIPNLEEGLKQAKEVFQQLSNSKLVGGLILTKLPFPEEDGPPKFLLESGDRSIYVTEEFMKMATPDWANTLRTAMLGFRLDSKS